MPRGDGTGPAAMGPMTGRAAGYCAGYGVPGFANPYGGRMGVPYGASPLGVMPIGYGLPYYGRMGSWGYRGFVRGAGRGMGLGRGRRGRW